MAYDPKIEAQIRQYKIQLKADSKNNLVRMVLAYMLEQAQMNVVFQKMDTDIKKLKEEAALAEGFIKENSDAFNTYVGLKELADKVLLEEKVDASLEAASGAAQTLENEKVG